MCFSGEERATETPILELHILILILIFNLSMQTRLISTSFVLPKPSSSDARVATSLIVGGHVKLNALVTSAERERLRQFRCRAGIDS